MRGCGCIECCRADRAIDEVVTGFEGAANGSHDGGYIGIHL